MRCILSVFLLFSASCSLIVFGITTDVDHTTLISCDNSGSNLVINLKGKILFGPVGNGKSIGDLQNPEDIRYASTAADNTFAGGTPTPGGIVPFSESEQFYTLEVDKQVGTTGFNLFVADPTQEFIDTMTVKGVFFDIDDTFQPGITWKVEGDCYVENDGNGNILIKTTN